MSAVSRRRRARAAVAMFCAWSLAGAGLVAVSGSAGASVSSDQSDISQLEQQITAQGAHEQALVSRYNEEQARLDVLDAKIARDQTVVAADKDVETRATSSMQQLAVQAYTTGSSTDSTLAMFNGTWSVGRMLEQNQYLDSVNTKLSEELTTLHLDVVHTRDAQHTLQSEQAQAKQTLAQLASARDAATAAISSDEARLTSVKGDLRALLAAANARRQAEQRSEERELAAEAAAQARVPVPPAPASTPVSSQPPPPATPLPSSSGYANPLRAVIALSPERIDQGVDYSGFGPIYAIGDGVVLNTVGNGWPGGTFIAYQLSDGPGAGLVVYAAEDIQPMVQVGQTVSANTVIGRVYEGPEGIETGWANGSALPDTMARDAGQFNGSNSSAFGYNFSQFLQSLGAPGGIASGGPSGSLPAGWPSW